MSSGQFTTPRPPARATSTRVPRALVGLALVALGVGGFLAGRAAPTSRVEVVSPAAPVNQGALDPTDIRANNSPSVASNPRNSRQMAVVNRVDSPSFSCRLHLSADAGRTWAESALPQPAGEEPRCFAPDLAYGADGRLHVSFVTLAGVANAPHAGWLVTSSDAGRTFSVPVRTMGEYGFGVRIAADPIDASRLYVAWLAGIDIGTLAFPDTGYPINLARSDDGGSTWSEPVRVSPPDRKRVVAAAIVARARGRVLVSYLDVGGDSLDYHGAHEGRGGPPYSGPWKLVVARSDDAGTTWDETEAEASLVPTTRFVVFTPPVPSLAASADGRKVYLAFTDGRLGDADVWVWASIDGGATFAPPRRVNDTPAGDGRTQDLVAIAVDPRGRLVVMYNDRRRDPHDARAEVSMQWSSDGGLTFTPRSSVGGGRFDTRVGAGIERDLPDLGSRAGLVSNEEGAVAVWTDTRAGNDVSLKQDLARALVEVADPVLSPAMASYVRGASAVAALAGLALLLVAGTRPGRARARPAQGSTRG